ncbi:uncharacterized protein LOC144141916 [Haemaphysalis longicornis]
MWTVLLLTMCHCPASAAPGKFWDFVQPFTKLRQEVDLEQFLNTSFIWTVEVGTKDRAGYEMEPQDICRVDQKECVSSRDVIFLSNYTFENTRYSERYHGAFFDSKTKPSSVLLVNEGNPKEFQVELLIYTSRNNDCGVFYVVKFKSSMLLEKINKTGKFPDLDSIRNITRIFDEVWRNIDTTTKDPIRTDEGLVVKYSDEAIMYTQMHKRYRGGPKHPNETEECDRKYNKIRSDGRFTPWPVYNETCPNVRNERRSS